jgi:hypothetical protein
MKLILWLLLGMSTSAQAQPTGTPHFVYVGDPKFEATLLLEPDFCPAGFNAARFGNKSLNFIFLGCWRYSADRKNIELFTTHTMRKRDSALYQIPVESRRGQIAPVSSFVLK